MFGFERIFGLNNTVSLFKKTKNICGGNRWGSLLVIAEKV
jgi:hypothetical protein